MRPETRGSYDYEILSDLNIDTPQDDEATPSPARMELLLGIPENLKARFRQIALPIVQNVQATKTPIRSVPKLGPWNRTSVSPASSAIRST